MCNHFRSSVFLAEAMAIESRRLRSCDQSRSGRVVILVQIISWCAVGALLILRGVTTLSSDDNKTTSVLETTRSANDTNSSRETGEIKGMAEEETVAEQNSTSTAAISSPPKGHKINPTSAILITVGTTMLVIGPTLLFARFVDSRRHNRQAIKFSKVDLPPSYEEVVDKVPRYSSLFQVTDSGELVPVPTHTNNSRSSTSCSVPV